MTPITEPLPLEPTAEQIAVRHSIARYLYYALAVAGALIALLFVVWPPRIDPSLALVVAGGFGAIGLLALAALRLPPRWDAWCVTVLTLASIVAIGGSALAIGWGISAPGIGLFGLYAGVVCAVIGARQGVLVALIGIAIAIALGVAQQTQWLPIAANAAPVALWFHVALQCAIILGGLGGGWVVSAALWRFVAKAQDRERRFGGLLGIAADAYWELDPQFRLTALTRERDGGRVLGEESGVGSVPWELPQFRCEAEVLDQLQADLEARQPFRDLPIGWADAAGTRHFLISGEPRIVGAGVFAGYWGVARDITADLQARLALSATETRYQDLFARIPTALVMHRNGRIIDANPAALTLFGFRDLAGFVGTDLLALYPGGDSRERARRRMEELQAMAPGDALPVAEFQVTARHGRRLVVRATGVAVETEDGPAVLSIYVDDTERRIAEEAVRRSEAMLSHLVASSPDVITLTDLATGRYAMVNQTFERVIGYRSEEVVGRTSAELGVWTDADARGNFIAALREHGRVQDVPTRFTTRDGRIVHMLVSGARFVMDRRDFLVINARDVTGAEQNRLEREAILDNASIGIAMTRDQRFQLVNPAFEDMLGWPAGSIVGQPGSVVWPDEAAYAEVGRRIGPALGRGEKIEIVHDVRRRDGTLFPCRMLARAVDPTHPSRGGTIWIVEDITERRRVEQALARARDDAEAASRAKSAFLANTSHELRTPLNGLLGMAQLARTPGLDPDRREQYLAQIVDSAQALAVTVSDILDLSKIEAGKLEFEHVPFDLRGMLESLHRGHAPQASARSLMLTLEMDAGIGHVIGDVLRVRQILNNFLGNALKFTLEGGVHVKARRLDPQRVRLEVHDTGPGIERDAQARLFQPFTQADDSTTRRFGGTGLGLSICQELAERMDGRVGVDSEPGRGSCFWAELPLPVADAAGAEPPVPGEASAQGVHVLMVDDNPINMMVGVAQLEQFGARVGQAVDGQQAIDAVRAAERRGDPFDVVMMDLQMPVKSGHEVTQELRRDFPPDRLPIVAYTAAALVTERDAALSAGMNDFLPKPTEPDRLRAMVARWAAIKRAAPPSSG